MDRFRVWRLRSGIRVWILILYPFNIVWAIVQDWLLEDITQLIRSKLGIEMNIVEAILSKPATIVLVLFTIAIVVWILKVGSKKSALEDIHQTILQIVERNKIVVHAALDKILIEQLKQRDSEVMYLALIELEKKDGNIDHLTIEELGACPSNSFSQA